MEREYAHYIEKDLEKKMVFLTGPRQVGKTWLAKRFIGSNSVYLNYDSVNDRRIIHEAAWLPTTDLLILDELHKMPEWKNYIKGVYDTKPEHLSILVTGSASLDVYRQTGDSLAGRYFTHRMFPFTPSEVKDVFPGEGLERFLERGGFPEPFLAESDEDAARWRRQYTDTLIREDIFTIETVRDLRSISLLLELLKERVGSPVSYQSLSEDLDCSPNTVKKYIDVLSALFIIFSVTPYSNNIARSIKKEPKIYFFDTGMVKNDQGKRLENLVALSLYKHCCSVEDRTGKAMALHYMRTKEGKEVDFLLTEENKPLFMVEVKRGKSEIPSSLLYFNSRYNIPGKLIVQYLRTEERRGTIEVLKAETFLHEI